MSQSVAALNWQSLPNDVEGMKKIGAFQLRHAIEKMGGLSNDDAKLAFAKMPPDEKADYALRLKLKLMQENGMNGAAMAPPTMAAPSLLSPPQAVPQQPIPAQTGTSLQMMPPPQVAAVDPTALAHAQAAVAGPTAATTTKAKREPKTAATEAPSDMVAQVVAALTQLGQGQNALAKQLQDGLAALHAGVTEAAASSKKVEGVEKEIARLGKTYEGVYNVLTKYDERLKTLQDTTNLAISLSLFLAEQVCQAPRTDLLQAAAADVGSIQALLGAPGNG